MRLSLDLLATAGEMVSRHLLLLLGNAWGPFLAAGTLGDNHDYLLDTVTPGLQTSTGARRTILNPCSVVASVGPIPWEHRPPWSPCKRASAASCTKHTLSGAPRLGALRLCVWASAAPYTEHNLREVAAAVHLPLDANN